MFGTQTIASHQRLQLAIIVGAFILLGGLAMIDDLLLVWLFR